MPVYDYDLAKAVAGELPGLPRSKKEGRITIENAEIWFAVYGAGPPVVLLHGGMGNSGNWGYLVPELVSRSFSVIVVDSRGQGRSSWDGAPFSYRRMADDGCAILDHLDIPKAAIVGWSDGAVTGLMMAEKTPERVAGLLFFACNVDPAAAKPFSMTPAIENMLTLHRRDYARLSPDPGKFDTVFEALQQMQATKLRFLDDRLSNIKVPVTICAAEHDEFIPLDHLEYLSGAIPRAKFALLTGVSHFAPLQDPTGFNQAIVGFLNSIGGPDWN